MIQPHQSLMLLDNRDRMYLVNLAACKKIKWRKTPIDLKALLGQPINSIFSVEKNQVVREDRLEFIGESEGEEEQDQTRDNRDLRSNQAGSQALTDEDIQKLKDQGTSGAQIVDQIMKNSKTFEGKTDFSQKKCLKKKYSKHVFQFRACEVTMDNLCEFQYWMEPSKINFLRPDALALLMHYSGMSNHSACNGSALVVDHCKGLLLAGLLSRLQTPNGLYSPLEVLTPYYAPDHATNFKKYTNVQYLPIAQATQDAVSFISPSHLEQSPPGAPYSRLVVAGELECCSLFQMAYTHLALGAVVTMYCQYSEPLVELWKYIQSRDLAINVGLFDVFTREHQVLPMRTHPVTMIQAFSGYVLNFTLTKTKQ